MKALAITALLALALAGCGGGPNAPTGGGPRSFLDTPPPPPPSYLK